MLFCARARARAPNGAAGSRVRDLEAVATKIGEILSVTRRDRQGRRADVEIFSLSLACARDLSRHRSIATFEGRLKEQSFRIRWLPRDA